MSFIERWAHGLASGTFVAVGFFIISFLMSGIFRVSVLVGVIVAGIYALDYASGARRALELDKIHVEKPPH